MAREVPVEVGPADGWSDLSERFFGDGSRAARIAADNGFDPSEPPAPGDRVVVSIRSDELEVVRAMAEARGPYNRGVELMQTQGSEQEALEAFERALERAPFFVDARYNLGLVLLRIGEPERARAHLERVAAERPGDKDARYAHAAAHFHSGDYAGAIDELEAALALDPEFLRARWTYALALQRSGRVQQARRQWEAYLERDDSSGWADQARQHLGELGS